MSFLGDAVYAAKGFALEKRELDCAIRFEVDEAKRIQRQIGCSWSEALRIASKPVMA